jgi:hypothetical protein
VEVMKGQISDEVKVQQVLTPTVIIGMLPKRLLFELTSTLLGLVHKQNQNMVYTYNMQHPSQVLSIRLLGKHRCNLASLFSSNVGKLL